MLDLYRFYVRPRFIHGLKLSNLQLSVIIIYMTKNHYKNFVKFETQSFPSTVKSVGSRSGLLVRGALRF